MVSNKRKGLQPVTIRRLANSVKTLDIVDVTSLPGENHSLGNIIKGMGLKKIPSEQRKKICAMLRTSISALKKDKIPITSQNIFLHLNTKADKMDNMMGKSKSNGAEEKKVK